MDRPFEAAGRWQLGNLAGSAERSARAMRGIWLATGLSTGSIAESSGGFPCHAVGLGEREAVQNMSEYEGKYFVV